MLLCAILLFCSAASAPLTDGEVWNEGVSYYRDGDATNASRVLRPLMLSKTHGPRAAEIVAKLAYDADDLEEASAAAQIALRSAPDDPRLNRNFTRATDGLAARRENRRVEAILKGAEGKDPGAILAGSTREARALFREAATFFTNSAPRQIALADSLSARARRVADDWLPVKEAICRAVTNEEQAATIALQVDGAREKSEKAAKEFSDLSAAAYTTMSEVENDCTRFLKLTALPPQALDEGGEAQTNAFTKTEPLNGRAWQQDALDFTRTFRRQFPAWAQAYEQQAQADTNAEPFTAEAQAKISDLSTRLEKLQIECVEKDDPAKQREALGLIDEIRALLPKDKNGSSGQQGKNDQKKQDQQNPDGQQDQQQEQDPDGSDQTQQDDLNGQQQEEEEKSAAQEAEEEEPTEEEKQLDALLRKAQERNDEHEADKRARMRKAPLPPNERDW